MKSKSEKNSKTHAISWLVRSQISVLRLPPPRPPAARSRESSGRERDFLAWFWGSGQKLSVSRISACRGQGARPSRICLVRRASWVVARGQKPSVHLPSLVFRRAPQPRSPQASPPRPPPFSSSSSSSSSSYLPSPQHAPPRAPGRHYLGAASGDVSAGGITSSCAGLSATGTRMYGNAAHTDAQNAHPEGPPTRTREFASTGGGSASGSASGSACGSASGSAIGSAFGNAIGLATTTYRVWQRDWPSHHDIGQRARKQRRWAGARKQRRWAGAPRRSEDAQMSLVPHSVLRPAGTLARARAQLPQARSPPRAPARAPCLAQAQRRAPKLRTATAPRYARSTAISCWRAPSAE